jgi:hypothetical protein
VENINEGNNEKEKGSIPDPNSYLRKPLTLKPFKEL